MASKKRKPPKPGGKRDLNKIGKSAYASIVEMVSHLDAVHSDDATMNPTLWITLVALGLGLEPETDVACEYVAAYAYDRAEACQGDDCPDAADGAYEDTMAMCFAAVDGSAPARAHFLALAGEAGR